jgi:hypothetical protein
VPVETPHSGPTEREDFILATYREIALRFRLNGPNAARTKAKRAGWTAEPSNHPADPLRIRVPLDAWDQASEREHPRRHEMPRPEAGRDAPSQKHETRNLRVLEAAVAALREALAAADARASWAEEAERSERARSEALREADAREIANLREAHGRALGTLRDDQDRLLATLRDEHGRLVAVLEAKAQAAEDRAEQIEARAEQTERAQQFERARAEELTARLAAERRVQAEEMARLHHQLDEARAGEAELTALRHAGELRRARGLVARLRAAWRGE